LVVFSAHRRLLDTKPIGSAGPLREEGTNGLTRHRRSVLVGAAAIGVAVATEVGRGRDLDRALYRRINAGWNPRADHAFKAVTEFGSIWSAVGAGSVVAARGRWREATDSVGAALAMWAVGQAAKRLVDRARPYRALDAVRLLIDPPRATSWPSSHPAVLLAFLEVTRRDLRLGPGTRGAELALVGAVGLSRVYLGVHYPADVVGGLLLGLGVADLWSAVVSPRILSFEVATVSR
jgi:membrane-associated phospholipid phosphatase